MIRVCPRCNQRYAVNDKIDVDYEHQCSSLNPVLDNEDVPKIGTYVDDNGNTVQVHNPLMQGNVNKLWGTRAWIDGADQEDITRRGNRISTTRTRQHFEFIKLKDTSTC